MKRKWVDGRGWLILVVVFYKPTDLLAKEEEAASERCGQLAQQTAILIKV